MVDLLRIFRRRGPARGRQGFARLRQGSLRKDITSLASRMGDIFKPVAGEKALSAREAAREPAPARREAVAATAPREPAPHAPKEPSAFGHNAPPIPRNLPREQAREPGREPARDQPRESAPRSTWRGPRCAPPSTAWS